MRRWLVGALLVAALAAAGGVYVTSTRPDGLERVTEDLRLPGRAAAAPASRARRSVLALLGALAVGAVAVGVGRLLGRARRPRPPER